MNKNIKLLNLLCFIFRVLFYAIKEKPKVKKEKIYRKEISWTLDQAIKLKLITNY
jgi:hypothetical protein